MGDARLSVELEKRYLQSTASFSLAAVSFSQVQASLCWGCKREGRVIEGYPCLLLFFSSAEQHSLWFYTAWYFTWVHTARICLPAQSSRQGAIFRSAQPCVINAPVSSFIYGASASGTVYLRVLLTVPFSSVPSPVMPCYFQPPYQSECLSPCSSSASDTAVAYWLRLPLLCL